MSDLDTFTTEAQAFLDRHLRRRDEGGRSFVWGEADERVAIVEECVAHLPNVRAVSHASLVVGLARDLGTDFIVKGLRTVSDFESELQQSQLNLAMSGIRTMFIPSATTHSFVASKWIREISRLGGDVTSMVPPPVAKRLAERFNP